VTFKFPNEKLVDQMNLANEWWSLIDDKNQREVPKRVFAKFLLERKIIKKELEAERVLKSMIDEGFVD